MLNVLLIVIICLSLFSMFCFVPMLCSLVLVVKCYAFSLSTSLFCPLLDFISVMQFPWVVALVECWTCKWYFALSLLACMSGSSFLVWMSIVVTIYKWLFVFGQAMVYCFIPFCLIALCLLYMHYKFFAYNDHIALFFFKRYLFLWLKSYTNSRVRCEWVLFNYSQLTC